jgi:L-ascorbate metabolism protein UlaG (beta-lactamase superfamily)
LTLDGVQLATDPILRRRVGFLHWSGFRPSPSELAAVDVVLLSHLHHDHTDLPSLRRFGPTTTFVVPAGGESLLRGVVAGSVVELDVGDATSCGPVSVTATPANHDGARSGGPSAPALGYLVQGSQSVYVAGDTDLFDGMAGVGDAAGPDGLDLALLPVGGWGLTLGPGHLDPERAAESLALLRPRAVVPVHWGRLRIPVVWRARPDRYVTPARRFARRAAVVAPGCRVLLPAPGEQLWIGS